MSAAFPYRLTSLSLLGWRCGYPMASLKEDLPLTLANAVMVVLTGAITLMKIVFERRFVNVP